MEIDVTFTPAELARAALRDRVVVILDVVRASTTMIQGIASGCEAFLPVRSVAAARRLARELPEANRLLGGERGGARVPGFDLGNSPWEYLPERVAGKTIVFTTTNGTAAINAARGAGETLIGAFVNLGAVTRRLAQRGSDLPTGQAGVTLAAAGRGGRPVLDDVACAGMMAQEVVTLLGGSCSLSDAARIAVQASVPYRGRLRELLEESASGRALLSIGYDRDLDFCARLSVLDVVPRVVEGKVGV